jgi:hypothetical protein
MWTVVVAALGFEAVTVYPPSMTGYRQEPPRRADGIGD